jgi:branched-chain amino acid aminotransferase
VPERSVWIDGNLVPAAHATVPLLSQSLQRGTLVFDVYAVEHLGPPVGSSTGEGRCAASPGPPHGFGAREHTERFLRSAELMAYPLRYGVDDLLAAAGAAVRANQGCDSLRLNVYWGAPTVDLLPAKAPPVVAVAAYAVSDFGFPARPSRPARLWVPGLRKVPDDVIPVQAKVAATYAHATLAKQRARAEGFDDVLFLDGDGNPTESGSMSFFLVVDDVLRVPGLDHVLDGITRQAVLELAADEGIRAEVGPVAGELLDVAQEAFLTSTTRNIWPVGRIAERDLPAPGPVTARLAARLQGLLRGVDPLSRRWLQPL